MKIIKVASFEGQVQGLTVKDHEGTFCGDGNVPHLVSAWATQVYAFV